MKINNTYLVKALIQGFISFITTFLDVLQDGEIGGAEDTPD